MRFIGLAVGRARVHARVRHVSIRVPAQSAYQRDGSAADEVGQNQQNGQNQQDDGGERATTEDKPGACESESVDEPGQGCAKALVRLFEQGKEIFRFDTFGDEDYWGGMLQLHKAVEGAALGGVGPGSARGRPSPSPA